ncbi:unnamed protein product [Rotaria socialis]
MAHPLIQGFNLYKKANAMLNYRLDLDKEIFAVISKTYGDIRRGHLNHHFPSSVVELSSCEQFNIKFNEIFEHRVNQILFESLGNTTHIRIHDYLNENQSPDIVFSIGMRIAVLLELRRRLYLAMGQLHNAFEKYEELSIYAHQVTMGIQRLKTCEPRLLELPVNDTVMNTGIKTPESFGKNISEQLKKLAGLTFVDVSNKFEDFNTYNIMAELSGTLNQLAVSLTTIANNIRMLCSIIINGTQYTAMATAAAQIMGNHMALTVVSTMGHVDITLLKPLIIKNVLYSLTMLSYMSENLSTWSPLERQTAPIHQDGLQSNSTLLSSIMESWIMPTSYEPEMFIIDSAPLSENISVFDNVGGTRSRLAAAATTATQIVQDEHGPGVEPNTTSPLFNLGNMVNTVESYILNDKKSKKTKKCHATQPNVNLPPPPPAQQQQQPTQEEAVRQLAEKLKIYPPPDSLFP